ncbi:hypothetical protein BDN67DRAFT_365949 [Paxillus ammoniavirescens]|nr:hypothetical protein BDN67DRAFT_365949 [Paxillus ammoniavirescens]
MKDARRDPGFIVLLFYCFDFIVFNVLRFRFLRWLPCTKISVRVSFHHKSAPLYISPAIVYTSTVDIYYFIR